jgi:phosphoglycolate phosphatase-like HAD superfamily hydrolase
MKIVLLGLFMFVSLVLAEQNVLPSWNIGKNRADIISYVKTVTDENSTDFIPKEDRIAVFDNDGTLWSEQPSYFQFFFLVDRLKALAPKHPEWRKKEAFKRVLDGNASTVLKVGKDAIGELILATHTGMSDEEFDDIVLEWIQRAKHPTKHVYFFELVFQPMLELLDYLRANGFKTFIVSGGGIDFMRPWASKVYGIPSYQIVGSELEVQYEDRNIIRVPKVRFINNKKKKPVGIHYHIGKRPVVVFGNSDGDFAMMEYTQAHKKYKTLQMYIHHTDEKREWSYDRNSHIGRLNKGLDYALKHNWGIVDMKNDWKVIYSCENKFKKSL